LRYFLQISPECLESSLVWILGGVRFTFIIRPVSHSHKLTKMWHCQTFHQSMHTNHENHGTILVAKWAFENYSHSWKHICISRAWNLGIVKQHNLDRASWCVCVLLRASIAWKAQHSWASKFM
jgi:hypothetical protein